MANETKMSKSLSYKILAGLQDKNDEEVKAAMRELAVNDTVITSVAGEISGYGVKTGQFGENISFNGFFVARSEITGEVIETTKMFFDKGFGEQLRAQFDNRNQNDEVVRFSAQISVVSHSKAPFFTYMAVPLRTPEAITRRAELLGTLASAPAQLPHHKPAKKSA